ncbi:hydantoinase/oxoprolinase N-terminal domain-containing protein [Candidatus Sodalis sp. SoCistrobi]|uniref:hydantoinase/oxoprolinase N-terminal domain-containing protein n=1 Tax=Candidatus Sodalis sp. SoCistrobi TaxID=1922216 RepID=UPI00093C7C72|nr:hydantoinase/oxoprolinase family protein [Candidatus Sodalis sp. SoCistrobi]
MSLSLGIDVGGTHTDAVLLDAQQKIIAHTKQHTSADVMQGIDQAVTALLALVEVDRGAIRRAMLGTTHCTNAIVERKGLQPVAHFRLGAPASLAVPPLTDMPADFRARLPARLFTLAGGYHYDGQIISALDEQAVRQQLQAVKGQVCAVSVCGIFSPVVAEQEQRVAALAREILGAKTPVSLSSEIGSIGLLERENATVLNAALCGVAHTLTDGFRQTLARRGIIAELFFGQNDGTLMPLHQAQMFPILTIASGPTNSLRGAAKLSNLPNALVVDVGGTTTDVGALCGGFPRQSAMAAEIGGVRTNFRMPDIASIGLGGGSVVTLDADGAISVGPESVGYALPQRALVFGGDTLTVTDIAVARGWADIGDATLVAHLCPAMVTRVAEHYVAMVEKCLARMNTSQSDMPVILVGGGAALLTMRLKGASEVIRPPYAGVANATGVAIAQVSGSVDTIVLPGDDSLESCLQRAEHQAREAAIAAGALPETVAIIELDSLPLGYMPANAIRIRARAVGTLAPER